MITKLFEEAFEEVGKKTANKTDSGRAAHLEYELREDFKVSVSGKSLIRYLKGESEPKVAVLDKIAEYLNYSNYKDYITRNGDDLGELNRDKGRTKVTNKSTKFKSRNVWIAFIALIIGNLTYIGFIDKEKNCMVWVNDHYEKSDCSGQALEFALNETELEKFRKIEICDTTTFFKKYDPVIWYDKFNNRMEYFTYYGINPINGRTLRPITQTIIDNHVEPCESLE
ncbi:helix-turn-helix domain-containing protein [Maribacter sp. 2307UL18-2]|uniref:helix-turn-helix domain-containing protein n=1 Tax=Maribacter sp. 2307UL18-2 TaxID=3386274 RepID=UPI0039BC2657